MIFVTGGYASGKTTFVRSLGYADSQMIDARSAPFSAADARTASSRCPVVLNAQELVARFSLEQALGLLEGAEVVCCCELGCGIVPLSADDRAFREAAGRLACALAERADCVVRMVCGIPEVMKGAAPWK